MTANDDTRILYSYTATPLATAEEIARMRQPMISGMIRSGISLVLFVIMLAWSIRYNGYVHPTRILIAAAVAGLLGAHGIVGLFAYGFSLLSMKPPVRVTETEREVPSPPSPEPNGDEMTSADTILGYMNGNNTPVHIPRTRKPQTVGGFKFSGKLLDALTIQERERKDGTLHRDSLVAAGLIGTTDYTAMTRALVEVGYAEPYGRGYKWTDAGRDWIANDRPTPSGV